MTQTEVAVETEPNGAVSDAAALVDYLRERDVACPLCRYNLRGLRTSRCPECGRELTLGVWLAEPRMAAWVAAAAASLLPAGVGVLLAFGMLASGWDMMSDLPVLMTTSIILFGAYVPIAAAVIFGRRWFMRLAQRTQWILATLLLLGGAGAFATYALSF